MMVGAMRRDADKAGGRWFPEWQPKRRGAKWGGINPNRVDPPEVREKLQSNTSLTLTSMRM